MKPFKLSPSYKDYFWGGNRLARKYGKSTDLSIVAESWELSCHPDGLSAIGGNEGITFKEWLERQNSRVLGSNCTHMNEFPLLVKLIDASRDLSIQVHPDDAYARRYENSLGKTEMWYVLEADENAAIYYGFNKDVNSEELVQAIKDDTLESLLNRVEVSSGDVFLIEPGTVHAIGAGIVVAEIQQSSNLTYRLYDYGRVDQNGCRRRLDINKSLSVINLQKTRIDQQIKNKKQCAEGYSQKTLVDCDYFTVELIESQEQMTLNTTTKSFEVILLVSGDCFIKATDTAFDLRIGDCAFVPSDTGRYHVLGKCKLLRIFAGKV